MDVASVTFVIDMKIIVESIKMKSQSLNCQFILKISNWMIKLQFYVLVIILVYSKPLKSLETEKQGISAECIVMPARSSEVRKRIDSWSVRVWNPRVDLFVV